LEVGRKFRDRLAESRPNLVGRTGLLIGIAAAVVALSLTGLLARGTHFGVEFSGGLLLEYEVAGTVDVEAVRAEMAGIGLPRAVGGWPGRWRGRAGGAGARARGRAAPGGPAAPAPRAPGPPRAAERARRPPPTGGDRPEGSAPRPPPPPPSTGCAPDPSSRK